MLTRFTVRYACVDRALKLVLHSVYEAAPRQLHEADNVVVHPGAEPRLLCGPADRLLHPLQPSPYGSRLWRRKQRKYMIAYHFGSEHTFRHLNPTGEAESGGQRRRKGEKVMVKTGAAAVAPNKPMRAVEGMAGARMAV